MNTYLYIYIYMTIRTSMGLNIDMGHIQHTDRRLLAVGGSEGGLAARVERAWTVLQQKNTTHYELLTTHQ